jgi:hypothetical protein
MVFSCIGITRPLSLCSLPGVFCPLPKTSVLAEKRTMSSCQGDILAIFATGERATVAPIHIFGVQFEAF